MCISTHTHKCAMCISEDGKVLIHIDSICAHPEWRRQHLPASTGHLDISVCMGQPQLDAYPSLS